MIDDCLVCHVFMHCLEVALQEIDEGVEPLEQFDKLKQEDVVGMAKADVCLFVLEDTFSILLVVVDIDDNPSEETEWSEITSLHHNGVALAVFQS